MVWDIGPVNEYEDQSAVITVLSIIIRKNINCGNNATSFL
jgi:hypothetical protein